MPRIPSLVLRLLLVGVLGLSAGLPGARAEDEGAQAPAYAWIGIDGVDALDPLAREPDRLAALGDVKGVLVRTRPIPWGSIQPRAPIAGRSLRDFAALDEFVAAWQRVGAEPVLVLSPQADWAASSEEASEWSRAVREGVPADQRDLWIAEGRGARPPRPALWNDWERFVRDLAERYDADGEADAPGVKRPVRWLQILDRPASPRAWTGSAAEYQRALHHAALGAELASRRVRVAAGAVDLGRDAHPPLPDEAEVRRRSRARLRGVPPAVAFAEARELDFDLEFIGIPGIFAAAAHVGRRNLRDEVQGPRVLADQLHRVGARAEVWLVDSPLEKTDDPDRDPMGRMSDEERRLRARWLAAVRAPELAEHDVALAWVERGRACDVARTVCAARAAGVERIFLGGDQGLDAWVPRAEDGGWKARPCVAALRQVVDRLSGNTGATEASLGRAATATTFRFPRGHAQPYVVVVTLDPRHSWAGAPTGPSPRWAVAVPLPDGTYRVETRDGDGARPPQEVRVAGGLLPLELGPEPVFIEPLVP